VGEWESGRNLPGVTMKLNRYTFSPLPLSLLLVFHLNNSPESRAVFAHLRDEFVKEIGCVVRTWSGFGMILDREDRQRFVSHSLQTTVIKIEVGQFNLMRIKTIRIDGEAMIVGGDFDPF
jgi:hypothetical protein